MAQSLRRSEAWFNRGLWVLAVIFAGFLIGLGGLIVGDLPRVEKSVQTEDFIDQHAAAPIRATIAAASAADDAATAARDAASTRLDAAKQAYASAHDTFENWLSTRNATHRVGEDAEVIDRTRALDVLQTDVTTAQLAVDRQQRLIDEADQRRTSAQSRLSLLEDRAKAAQERAADAAELRVFLYRLALTLPLLAAAFWLFRKWRKNSWWPFVWGFIFFALYAFFVELVPYLPSYGGYVHVIVGIVLTVVVGRYLIRAMNAYLARQREAEQQPDKTRRDELSYDTALGRLSKSVCPGCERPVDLKNPENDFCQHCGICLFDHCAACDARKSAFVRFCHACGVRDETVSAA